MYSFVLASSIFFVTLPIKLAKLLRLDKKRNKFLCFALDFSYLCTINHLIIKKRTMSNFKQLPTLGFVEACKLASSRLTEFSGRSRRSELWWWMLVVMIINEVASLFSTNLLVSAIISIIVMFFGLSVTVRRVQDTGKPAFWVYLSYGLGIIYQLYIALSGTMASLVEMVQQGDMEKISEFAESNMGDFGVMSGIGTLWSIASIVVIVFCLLDSDPQANKYGDSPKYIVEE